MGRTISLSALIRLDTRVRKFTVHPNQMIGRDERRESQKPIKKDIRYRLPWMLALALPACLPAQFGKTLESQPARVAKVSGFNDQAAFLLYLNGRLILTNIVAWKENGTFESKGEGIAEGETIRMATRLASDPAGYWSEVWMEMPIHKTVVARTGNTAVLTLPDGETRTVALKRGVFPFVGMVGLNLYTRFYDETKGGKQILPILIPHKKTDRISLEWKGQFLRVVAGKKLKFREFELKAGDLEALVWIDARGRLIRSQQLDEGSVFIRQGYEALRGER